MSVFEGVPRHRQTCCGHSRSHSAGRSGSRGLCAHAPWSELDQLLADSTESEWVRRDLKWSGYFRCFVIGKVCGGHPRERRNAFRECLFTVKMSRRPSRRGAFFVICAFLLVGRVLFDRICGRGRIVVSVPRSGFGLLSFVASRWKRGVCQHCSRCSLTHGLSPHGHGRQSVPELRFFLGFVRTSRHGPNRARAAVCRNDAPGRWT